IVQPNPVPEVQTFLAEQINAAASRTRLLTNLPSFLPARLASDTVLSPWRGKLLSGPEQELSVENPKNFIPISWRVVISDNRGEIFQTLKGKGRIPSPLNWNGRGHSGELIKVGLPYSY